MKDRRPSSPAAVPNPALPARATLWERFRHWLNIPAAVPSIRPVAEVSPIMAAATARAIERGSSVATSDDLFLALGTDTQVCAAIQSLGADFDGLASDIASSTKPTRYTALMSFTLAGYTKLSHEEWSLEFCTFLAAIRPETALSAALLSRTGLTPRQLLGRFAHPGLPLVTVPPGADDTMAALTIFNDTLSTQEDVFFIFKRIYEMSPPAAHDLMMEIHHKGSAQVALGTYGEMLRLLEATEEAAAALGMPLRIELWLVG